MSNSKVCRICLQTNLKLYNFNLYNLKSYYEEIMASKIDDDEDDLPQQFCYQCASLLHKFHKFKEKCVSGQTILKDMVWHGPINLETVKNINKTNKESRLLSYSVMNIINTVLKTAEIQDKKQLIKLEKIDIDELSNGSVSDREDLFDLATSTKDINCGDKNVTSVCIVTDNGIQVKNTKKLQIRCKKKKKNITSNAKIKELEQNGHWKVTCLNEEDALKMFQAKKKDKKYLEAPYKCSLCHKWFMKQNIHLRHKELRHIEKLGSIKCKFCGYRFNQPHALRKHIKQHYIVYQCLRCKLQCSLETTALLHEEYHSGVTRKCTHCDEVFRHASTYYTHLRTHRSEHVCALCGASFVSAVGLGLHKKIKHILHEPESPDEEEDVNTYCKPCDIRFETRKAFEEHLFHSALHEVQDNGTASSGKTLTTRKVLSKKAQAKCIKVQNKRSADDQDIPNEVTKRPKKKIKRAKAKPTSCHQCGEHFATQAACMKHHTQVHPRTSFVPPSERIICEMCGVSLAPGSLAMHQNIHSREVLHPCDICPKQFHSIMGLRRHRVIHTGEKPFGCSLCDKRFTQSNSMKLHYRTIHLKQPYPKRVRIKKVKKPKSTNATVENPGNSSEENPREQLHQMVLVENMFNNQTDSKEIYYLN